MNGADRDGRPGPEPAFIPVLAFAAFFIFFTNLCAAAGYWLGRPPSFTLAAGLGMGLSLALLFPALKKETALRSAFLLSALFLLMSLPLYLVQRANMGHDWLCHVPLTGSLLRGQLPARDLASPERLLPYHYGFNIMAAAVLRIMRWAAPAAHTETALDLASWAGLALLLMAAWTWLRRLNRELPEPARIGRGETVLALALMLYGGGLIFLGRLVDSDVDMWSRGLYTACHPLPFFVGRRPTPLGQALFLFQGALLLFPRESGRLKFVAFLVTHAVLLLVAEDLFLAGVLTGLLLRLSPAWRKDAATYLCAAAAALPLACVQGGLITAALVNAPAGEGMLGWRLRAPFMPGWGLGEPGFLQGRFWAALLVEFPPSLWLIPLAGWAARRRGLALPPAWKALAACCVVFLLVPMFVQSRYAPNDLHRLFFLPQMISLLLLPMHLRLLIPARGLRRIVLVLLTVLLAAGPLSALRAELRHFDRLYGRGWRPDLALPAPPDRFEDGQVWLVSTPYLPALHYNGIFALSAPFGTYGPNVFKIYPKQHEEWLARYLEDPVRHGATRALLTREDLETLRARGVPHRLLDTVPGPGGEEVFILAFPPPPSENRP
ncbi:MAG: hypothetical protein KA248_10555 [Kiritimatiellae bacterium]|nr:hypothetical protein [Kiritimatiellia bacterium]